MTDNRELLRAALMTTSIVVTTRSGQLVVEPQNWYEILLDDDTWAWRRGAELAVGDVLQARGRITAVWRTEPGAAT